MPAAAAAKVSSSWAGGRAWRRPPGCLIVCSLGRNLCHLAAAAHWESVLKQAIVVWKSVLDKKAVPSEEREHVCGRAKMANEAEAEEVEVEVEVEEG